MNSNTRNTTTRKRSPSPSSSEPSDPYYPSNYRRSPSPSPSPSAKPNIGTIVKKLKEASTAYYNTAKPIMTDDEFDALREHLEELDPTNPYLKEIGAKPVKEKTVVLPYTMASLNKIKPNTGAVAAFVKKSSNLPTEKQSWIISEKLDGISALWYEGKLYLRGDGVHGVDVSAFAPYMLGLLPNTEYAIRGELVLPRGVIPGTLARSWVNGQLHQKAPIPEELKKIHFVTYEIINVPMTAWNQLTELKKLGFEIPWRSIWAGSSLNEEALGKMLLDRREKSIYDTDGLVVSENRIQEPQVSQEKTKLKEAKNPTYKVAFKMLLTDQCSETTVQEVEWNASAQGFLIPRIRITPVVVGTARIEFITGHNARFIVDNKIGVGAKIIIRRSGDVIPAVERVVVPSTLPPSQLLPTNVKWKWYGNDPTSAHILMDGDAPTKEMLSARLVLFAKTMGIDGLGPGVSAKLVDAGISTIPLLWTSSSEKLATAIGKANGAKIAEQLRKLQPTEEILMVASGFMPRGVGERKLKIVFETEPDPRKWFGSSGKGLPVMAGRHGLPPGVMAGWSVDSLNELKESMVKYEAWRQSELTLFPYPILPSASSASAAKPKELKGTICFTGVRSKELEGLLESAGWKVVDSVTSKLNVLVVPDGEQDSTTGKAKKARDFGTVRILQLHQVKSALGL